MNKPKCKHLEIPDNSDLKVWIEEQAKDNQLKYLLAHANDGVIWGYFNKSYHLITADSVFPQFPKLHCDTLQQCRIFGNKSEVMIWKTDRGFKARLIEDDHLTKKDYITEAQVLWGTQKEEEKDDFTLVSDGKQGLRHAVPLTGINFKDNERPLRLTVHHYIDYDDSGVARIDLSRLVNLTTFQEVRK
ncbi:CRISPR-associated protein Csx19 [Dolichospermum sp. LEGE 00246]|uniref:type III-D CRISPR-associated protein Csx19 n=1 Tax=Dolichospermum sp. LEGE 00246 TaxID=1828605 RepID=UPI00187FDB9D|nr:CRISPR-associated protein Csx19 [Dolichospermum sp. LEGE 00246]MBE9256839.1 TIGR03984 family CRISPR-associated protein [Dolichospermum sp. LEGE 00246]